MENLHDLATTVGSAAAISVLCAMAAGLAAVSLMAGVARIKRDTLPGDYPGDAEALQSKYVLAFEQLNDARKENPGGLKNTIAGLKGQPAPALCLTAFDQFASASLDDDTTTGSGTNNVSDGSAPGANAGAGGAVKGGGTKSNFGRATKPGVGSPKPSGNPPGKSKAKADPDSNPSRLKSPPNIKGPGGEQGK